MIRNILAICIVTGLVISSYLITSSFDSDDSGPEKMEKVMMAESLGRLGNNMFEFAALFALARVNQCRATMTSRMGEYIKSCFSVSLSVNTKRLSWRSVYLDHLMRDEYLNITWTDHVKLTGYPSDWRYFEGYEKEIRNEFRFTPAIQSGARNFLRAAREGANSTLIGIHVRRTDYLPYLNRQSCHVADEVYLDRAMKTMVKRHPDEPVVFVVASDDISWCKNALNSIKIDAELIYVNETFSPCLTMAILANCDHSIVTQGSFGFWSAFLANGDVIYYSNYCNNDTDILRKFRGMHLPFWIPISANETLV